MLLLAGFAAGFVADQIKRSVVSVFLALEERQRIVSTSAAGFACDRRGAAQAGTEIASKRTFVCVMFMDIRGFTPLVEKKPPEEYVAYQNAVFGEAIETVDRNHGMINQFLGDGFMATFGAPVATGRDCRQRSERRARASRRDEDARHSGRIPATTIGVGLHAGEAVCGNVGSARQAVFDHRQRRDPRLANRAAQQGLRIADPGLGRSPGEPPANAGRRCQALGAVHVKGRDAPIEIYRLA